MAIVEMRREMKEAANYGVGSRVQEGDKKDRTKRIIGMYRWFVNTFNAHPDLILVDGPKLTKKRMGYEEGEAEYKLRWKAREED